MGILSGGLHALSLRSEVVARYKGEGGGEGVRIVVALWGHAGLAQGSECVPFSHGRSVHLMA